MKLDPPQSCSTLEAASEKPLKILARLKLKIDVWILHIEGFLRDVMSMDFCCKR